MKYIKLIITLTLFFLAVYPGNSLPVADSPPKRSMTDTVFKIQPVIVQAKHFSKDVIPAQILSGDELRRLSVVSVADAIRYFSGVQIKDYGGIGGLKTVNIRSMGTQHVGVFYDGIQLGNAQNGQVDLGRFSMDNMEAISLYNGQKSNIFQTAKDFASAGSVYMTTRTPTFDKGKRNNLRLALKGGSFETINPSVLWERRLRDNLDASLNAEYMSTSGRYKFTSAIKDAYDTTEVRRNGDVRALRIEGGLYGKMPRGDWKAKLYYYDSERGYPGASVREEPGKFVNEDRQWDHNFFAQASLRQFYKRYCLMLNAKYAYDYMHFLSDPRLDVTTMYVNNTYKQQEAYVSAANEFVLYDWWRVSLSSDLQYNTLDADLVNFAYPSRYSFLTAAATALDFQRFKFQASLLYTHVHDITRTEGGSAGNKNEWTPTLVAMYKPFAETDLSVRAFYKRIFRMPTFNDLYYTFIGDINIKPEFTTQYNIGVVYGRDFTNRRFKRLELRVDAYFNQIYDKIVLTPSRKNLFRMTIVNLGYVEIRGIDLSTQQGFRFGKVEVNTQLNYTFQKAQDFTDKTVEWYGGQIPYIPVHSGSFIASAIYGDWDLNYSFIYTAERYESSANIPENYAKPWYTNDLSLSRVIRLPRSELRITVEVNNVFDQQFEVIKCYPMPGTNFKIKINWTL